jgi:hypothetical protein
MSEALAAGLKEFEDTRQSAMPEAIAARIIAMAKFGVRDPGRLRAAALAAARGEKD